VTKDLSDHRAASELDGVGAVRNIEINPPSSDESPGVEDGIDTLALGRLASGSSKTNYRTDRQHANIGSGNPVSDLQS